MTARQRVTLRWFFLTLSVCAGICGLYLLGIMRAGEGRYPDLTWPLVGLGALSVSAGAVRGHSGRRVIIRRVGSAPRSSAWRAVDWSRHLSSMEYWRTAISLKR